MENCADYLPPTRRIVPNSSSEKLVLFGGAPAFTETLHVGRPNIPNRKRFMQRMEAVLDSYRLTNFGPQVVELEQQVAEIAGTRHCVATSNATTGLELAIRALGMEGEVIVPSFTFIAGPAALSWQGIQPVFCDIDPQTHCLDPARVEAAITPQTTGILAVHLWGNLCDVEALQEIADRHALKLLFDAAHAFGCTVGERSVGGFGHAEVFSFHATKFINAFEGGAIVTDDDELAKRLRFMTNFGFSAEDEVSHLGVNGKMSEASAAMGLTSLEAMSDIIAHNRRIHEAYMRGLEYVPGIRMMQRNSADQHNYHYIVAELDSATAGLSRDELVATLRLENVMARRYFHPGCHRMQPYRELYPNAGLFVPETEALAQKIFILPTGLAVSEADVGLLTNRVAMAVRQSDQVRVELARCQDPRLPYFSTA
ncbi:MAG: aminotransferase class I/II-fold pyridoxal phosphate-dependent enzyme [Pseudomonadales bacterium]